MNAKKVVLPLSIVLIVGLMLYVMSQGGSGQKKTDVEQKAITKTEQKGEMKSDEELKLEELKQKAATEASLETSKLYATRCAACHGASGGGTMIAPPINGKTKEYILSKLDDYKNDRVTNSLMKGLLTNATPEELESLADEISRFK